MQIKLHKLATTTPALRSYIWNEVNLKKRTRKELAKELKLNVATVSKWSSRSKDELWDRSHAKHNLNLLLNPREEEIIKYCRGNIGLSIVDICIVLSSLFDSANKRIGREIKYSRKSIDCCIKRHKLKTPVEILKIQKKIARDRSRGLFEKVDKPGFIHMDFKYLPRVKEINPSYKANSAKKGNTKYLPINRSFMFSAIDRYSRYVYTEILEDKSLDRVVKFLRNVLDDLKTKTKNKYKVFTILTDNGGEFTDRYSIDIAKRKKNWE
jgi:hypothetical protein